MIQKIFPAFGTLNTISIFDTDNKNDVLDEAERLLKNMHTRWSVFLDNSEISLINRLAGQEFVTVCPDTYDILAQSVMYSRLTNGIFDVTMQPLIEYLTLQKCSDTPSSSEAKQLRSLVIYKDILFHKDCFEVKLKHPEQKISLGAIAKGYAADKITELFKQNGIPDAVINLGGTVSVIGKERTVGLQHPLKRTGQIMGELLVKDKMVVTSGAYEQEYIKNGISYHHILDPRTGISSESDLRSVTLVGENGAMLDALATAIFILGLEQGYLLVKKLGLQAVFVTNDLNILATDGLKKTLKIELQEEPV